ncbi:MAG: DUF4268 domain-containing protein [Actinomycetota bacterium]
MSDLSSLIEVDPRTVWPHEAQHFTPWLRDNADHLARALGIELSLDQIEHKVGQYSLDIIGRDLTNDCGLVVENQLTATDHVHLGQLLTYAAGTDAGTIVWVATKFNEEHRQAIDFLNSVSADNARFFGVVVQVVQIDDSKPAPLFTLAAYPNDWHATLAQSARIATAGGKAALYQGFWEEYLVRLHAQFPTRTNVRKAPAQNWLSVNFRRRGHIQYSLVFGRGDQIRAEVYIDTGDGQENLAIFELLLAQRDQIETDFGRPLTWEELSNRRACRIFAEHPGSVTDDEHREEILDWMLDQHGRLTHAFDARIAALPDPF